ncbi:MAG: hypothetical protein AAGE65_00240 [Planctomycetota bacterium]
MIYQRNQRALKARRRGLSIAEMLVSLSITSLLLTATMVAIDASFKSYANAAESASTQVSTRMVVHRLLHLIRTGTEQGPLTIENHNEFGSGLDAPTIVGDTVTSSYMHLFDRDYNQLTLIFDEDRQTLFLETDASGTPIRYALLGGVLDCTFILHRRQDVSTDFEMWLEHASIDMTVTPDAAAKLDLEEGQTQAVRVVASTAPRRLR